MKLERDVEAACVQNNVNIDFFFQKHTVNELTVIVLRLVIDFLTLLRNVFRPIVVTFVVIALIITLVGVGTRSQRLTKVGFSIMAGVVGVIVLYFLSPILIGWLWNRLNQYVPGTSSILMFLLG